MKRGQGICRTCGVVICHGLTEYKFVKSIKSVLKLNIGIQARDKGRSSIQINKLPGFLANTTFRDTNALLQKYPNIEQNKKKLINFKIFTLMDVDDCDDNSITKNYLEGHISGIGNHELKKYITPIYCKENFEDVLRDINFPYVAKSDKDKKNYIKVFDPVNGVLVTEEGIIKLCDDCKQSNKTNLDDFLTYCLQNQPRLN